MTPLTPSQAYDLDRHIVDLVQRSNQRRLSLGQALASLHDHQGAKTLGFTDTAVYAHEVIQERRRWCDDSRRVATRLRELPILRDALTQGILGWSMVELIARHATPEIEEALVTTARMSTVRDMRTRLQATTDDEVPAERSTIAATVSRTDAWYLESTRMLVAALTDSDASDDHIEALLAEGMTRLAIDHRGIVLPDTGEYDKQLAARRAQMSASDERKVPAPSSTSPTPIADELPSDPLALHDHIVAQLSDFAATDLDLAHAIRRLDQARPWRTLGFDALGHYARERLGVSEQCARNRIQLAAACAALPELDLALRDGRIGVEAARMIGRVATANTVEPWIARAEQRTVKHLREEVEAAALLSASEPPDDETLAQVHDLERAVLAGVVGLPQMSAEATEADATKVVVKLPMRDDQARFWRALEDVYSSFATTDMPFVTFLCRSVWESWRDSEARLASFAYVDVYLRERFRCACPVCARRDVTAHHVKFRSQGGGEDRDNLSAICSACHLDGIHGGRLRVAGQAPQALTWSLLGGRWVVDGRVKRAA